MSIPTLVNEGRPERQLEVETKLEELRFADQSAWTQRHDLESFDQQLESSNRWENDL